MVKSISDYAEQPWRRRFPLLLLQELWYKTPKTRYYFLVFHTSLCRVEQSSRSCFHDHLQAQKTDAHQQASTQVIRMLSSARLHPVHKITTTCNNVTTQILWTLQMGLFDITVCSYLKFWNSWYNYIEKIVIIIATIYDERLQYIKRQTLQ